MKTKTILWKDKEEAIAALKRGAIVVFPTETVYGIACLASSKKAFKRLCEIKGRPEGKPFTLMCSSLTQVAIHCEIDCGVAATMKKFMPGEITLLLKAREGTPDWVDLGTGVIGVRVPNAPKVLSLIEEIGEPLLVSSANLSGGAPALTGKQAEEIFNEKVAVIVEGECVSSVPSTVVSCVGGLKLIRQGNVPFESVKEEYNNAKFTVAIGSDHGGFEYKTAAAAHLKEKGFAVNDFGCMSKESVDYPHYAQLVGKSVSKGESDLGVLICTSGEGISMAANKVRGIRCGIGYDDVATGKTREHNNANTIAFGQKYMKLEDVLRRIDIFMVEKFSEEEKHHRRVKQIDE